MKAFQMKAILLRWLESLEDKTPYYPALFKHPHFYAASILAKIAVHGATFIWSVLVILESEAFKATQSQRFNSIYAPLIYVMPENAWALMLLICSSIGCARIWFKVPPSRFGSLMYGLLAFFWCYLGYATWFVIGPPYPPTFASSITIVAVISLYAFITSPRVKVVEGDALDF